MNFTTPTNELSTSTLSGNMNLFGMGFYDNDFLTNSDLPPGCDWNPLPADLTVDQIAIAASPGTTQNWTFHPRVGIPSANFGPSATLLAGGTLLVSPVSLTVSAPANGGELATKSFEMVAAAAAADSITFRSSWRYFFDSPFDMWAMAACGFIKSNGTVTPVFSPVAGSPSFANASGSSTTHRNVVPAAGMLQYLLTVVEFQSTDSAMTLTVTLRKNGSDTGITTTFTNTASPLVQRDMVNTVEVVAGDLINYKIDLTGPLDIAHRFAIYNAIGFLPADIL